MASASSAIGHPIFADIMAVNRNWPMTNFFHWLAKKDREKK